MVREARPGDGRRLEELLEEGFARMPQPEQVLWVLEDNARGRGFYEVHGFHPDGGRQVLPLRGEPGVVRYRRVSRASR